MQRKTIHKDWLKSLGITNVTDDGHIFKGDIELSQTSVVGKHKYGTNRYYRVISIYDPEYYIEQKERKCKYCAGIRALLVSRVVFAWKWGTCPGDRDVDHIDDNPFNNNVNNLQLLTRAENLAKRNKTHVEIAKEYKLKRGHKKYGKRK